MSQKSYLKTLKLEKGMAREALELMIVELSGVESNYNVYTMYGETIARYQEGDAVLVVQFEPGAAAPWVELENGDIQHLPPIDSTVESWKIEC